ncbi:MAG: substrate-binding domain-containing protein [Halanaerobiales bacterium]
MKKVIFLFIAVLMVFIFYNSVYADWLDKYLDEDYTADNNGEIRIGFLLKTMQEERYLKDRDAFFEKADELDVEVIFAAANNDEQTQLEKLDQMIAKGADVIVLQPVNTETASILVDRAHQASVPVVNYDSLITNSDVDVFLTQNSWAIGELQGEAMVEWFEKHRGRLEGNVVLLRGQPGDSNALAFSQGVLNTINKYPGLKLVVDQAHENWSPELAMATTEKALEEYSNDIDAVIANNSGMADGAVRALEAMGHIGTEKVFVAGSDADLTNIRYIVAEKQNIEIFKKIKPLAYKSVEVAVALARNPDSSVEDIIDIDRYVNNGQYDIPTVVTPVVTVHEGNIMETVVAEEFHSEADIYGQ